MRPKTVTLRSGLGLSYAERGAPKGLPVLMLHGYSDSWRSFEPVLERLPGWMIRAIAISQRGHGDSAKPTGRYTVGELAHDALDAMDHLGIDRAVLLGHSMGSLVAARLAADQPERVMGLLLVGAFKTLKGNPAVEELWRESVATMADPIDPEFVRAFQQSTLARPVPQAFLERVVSESLKVPAHVWRSALGSMLDEDGSGALGRISAPTRIIWGDQDSFAHRVEQQALVAAIRGATLVAHAGAGHAPHWEDPRRVAAEVVTWTGALTAFAARAAVR